MIFFWSSLFKLEAGQMSAARPGSGAEPRGGRVAAGRVREDVLIDREQRCTLERPSRRSTTAFKVKCFNFEKDVASATFLRNRPTSADIRRDPRVTAG